MDGLTGIFSKLHDPQISLNERVELGSELFKNQECFLPNKNQILADWLCRELHHLQVLKGKKDGETSLALFKTNAELWSLLHKILKYPSGPNVLLRQRFLPVLFGELATLKCLFETLGSSRDLNETERSCAQSVFLCCQDMFQDTQISSFLFSKLENVEQCLMEILSCILVLVLQPSLTFKDHVQMLCGVACVVLQQYSAIQQQQVAQRKVFTSLCEKLLHLLLMVKTAINDDAFLAKFDLEESARVDTTSKINALLVAGLFHNDHIQNFKPSSSTLNLEEPLSKRPRLLSYFSQLFEALRGSEPAASPEKQVCGKDQERADLWKRSISQSLPFILEMFLKAAKDNLDGITKFSFLVELYGLNDTTEKSTNLHIPGVNGIAILNKMLHVLVEYDVYQIAEDNVHNQVWFKWFVKLTKCLLQSPKDCDVVLFQSLDTLMKLNHKILEQFLDRILERCLVKSLLQPQLAKEQKAKVFCSFVETYSKLQQMEHFVKCILKVVKNLDGALDVIPVEVIAKFAKAFEHCPLSLTLSLYQLFFRGMEDQVECLGERPFQEVEGFAGVAMEVTVVLFVAFLSNSSYNAAEQHGVDAKKADVLRQLLKATKVRLVLPLIKAFPISEKRVQRQIGFSALYLLHGVNQVTSFLSRHGIPTDSGSDEVQISWNSELKTFTPDHSWNEVQMVAENGCLQYCIALLIVQRTRSLLAAGNPDLTELNCLVTFLFDHKHSHFSPKSVSHYWNGDPCSITKKNYPTAYWSLICKNAALLLPYCSDHQIYNFAKIFLRTLSYNAPEMFQDFQLTVSCISENLLQANEILALPSFQAAVVKEFWKLIGNSSAVVIGNKFPELSNVFFWNVFDCLPVILDSEAKTAESGSDFENQEVEFQESSTDDSLAESPAGNQLESLATEMHHASSIAHDLVKLVKAEAKKIAKKGSKKKEESVEVSNSLCDVENLLEVLQRLPCSSFTPRNQLPCILGLWACDVFAEKCSSTEAQSLRIALSCRRPLITFLRVCLQRRDFTSWQMVNTEALFSWLHATILRRQEDPPSELQSQFASMSGDLLGLAVKLGLKSRSQDSLTGTFGFADQLLDSLEEITPANAKNLEVIFTVVAACTELLEEKFLRKSSLRTISGVIIQTAVSLMERFVLSLEDNGGAGGEVDDEGTVKLQNLVLRLTGTITKAIGLLAESKVFETVNGEERLEEWGRLVALAVKHLMEKLKQVTGLSKSSDQAVSHVTVLEGILKGRADHRQVLPDGFRSEILKLCLDILITRKVFLKATCGDSEQRCELREVILQLFSTILEMNDGDGCASLLETIVELSIEEVDEEPSLKLITGLSIFKILLSEKVVKKRRKDLRVNIGNVFIKLLNTAASNVEVLSTVVEVIAGVVTLGAGSLYPRDIPLVFQALALAREVKADDLEMFSRIFMARHAILSWTLFYYPDFVYGLIHVFLTGVRDLLSSLLSQASKTFAGKPNPTETRVLTSCAQKMARLYQELYSHKDVLSKYSTYFVADCLHELSTYGIPGLIRDILTEGVHYLLDIGTEETLTKVHVYLPNNERELFRSLKEDFLKHHKFKGNA